MKCLCGGKTDAIDGRYVEAGYWRKRICQVCGQVSTTLEQVCVTDKGTRVKKPVIHAPDVPVVTLPRQRDPVHKPTKKARAVLDQRAENRQAKAAQPKKAATSPASTESARSRIEDMKRQRELDDRF